MAPYELWNEFLRQWFEDQREGITLRAIHGSVCSLEGDLRQFSDDLSDFKQRVTKLEGLVESHGVSRTPTGSYVVPPGGFQMPPPQSAPNIKTPHPRPSFLAAVVKDGASKFVAGMVPIIIGVIIGALTQRGCTPAPVVQQGPAVQVTPAHATP